MNVEIITVKPLFKTELTPKIAWLMANTKLVKRTANQFDQFLVYSNLINQKE